MKIMWFVADVCRAGDMAGWSPHTLLLMAVAVLAMVHHTDSGE